MPGSLCNSFQTKCSVHGYSAGERHGGEPNLPIDARLIRGNERRPQIRITRFGFEFVFLPFGIAGNNRVVGSFENDLVAFLADGAECAVGVNETKPIEGRVHHLPFRNEIGDGRDAQIRDQERQSDGDGVVDARRLRFLRRTFCALNDRPWKNSPKEGVIKTSEKWNNRHVIQEREVAADDENDLKTHQQDRRRHGVRAADRRKTRGRSVQ